MNKHIILSLAFNTLRTFLKSVNLLPDTISFLLLRTRLLHHMSRDLLRGVPEGSPSATEVNN